MSKRKIFTKNSTDLEESHKILLYYLKFVHIEFWMNNAIFTDLGSNYVSFSEYLKFLFIPNFDP